MQCADDNNLAAQLAELRAEILELRDRQEIGALFDTFFFHEDRRRLDDEWARSVFTDDVLLELPPQDYRGIEGLAQHIADVVGLFGPTHHATTDCRVQLAGDIATAQVNLTAAHRHLPPADQGPLLIVWGYIEAEARRSAAGWRLNRMALTKVLKSGNPPAGFVFDTDLQVHQSAPASR